MKVLIAMDSFKGSVSSLAGSEAIALGIRDVYPDVETLILPLADGGEGTVDCLIQATSGVKKEVAVTGPLGRKADAVYGILGDGKTAVIEIASACGLPLVEGDQRNPMVTTSYGVGELIVDAIQYGCKDFIIGLGGSATNDAGVGMLQALGYRFLNDNDEEVGFGGQMLRTIKKIDMTHVLREVKDCSFKVACDVNNVLYGVNGAAHVFGPQKGATLEMVKQLDEGLEHFASIVLRETGKDIYSFAGAGAAGGLGAAFSGFLQAKLQSGIELVLDHIKMEEKMRDINFVITGEGKLDAQTSMGKAPIGVARLAEKNNLPVIALAGCLAEEAAVLNNLGITSFFPIIDAPMSLEKAMDSEKTFDNLRRTANQLFRLIKAVQDK